ncbi:MAG: urate hydroxylase PuuD [Planctomycetota bacterium]|nr:urate hydroxylase PuuD [Planctomycetota bacterium]
MIALASQAMDYVELGDRWIHFLAGVVWLGLLYFFNWVNSAFAPTMDAETKKKVVPELMPRALWWFRQGAALTWITGVLLMFIVYYHGPYLLESGEKAGVGKWLPGFAGLIVGFFVYDTLFKALAKQHALGVVVWSLIAIGFAWFLKESLDYSERATYIHVAALFGTAMAANVWMRIWPAQKRIIAAIKAGEKPDSADPAMAGLRSKHNTYMSVSLLLFMIGVGQPMMFNQNYLATIAVVLAISFVATWLLYAKAKKIPGM